MLHETTGDMDGGDILCQECRPIPLNSTVFQLQFIIKCLIFFLLFFPFAYSLEFNENVDDMQELFCESREGDGFSSLDERPGKNFEFVNRFHESDIQHDQHLDEMNYEVKEAQSWSDYLFSTVPGVIFDYINDGKEIWNGNTLVDNIQLIPEMKNEIDCSTEVVIPKQDLWDDDIRKEMNQHTLERSVSLLRECGFVILEDFYSKEEVTNFKESFLDFKETKEADEHFQYPCQGEGRYEYMMPFRSPFNDTIHKDGRLVDIVSNFLGDPFKVFYPFIFIFLCLFG